MGFLGGGDVTGPDRTGFGDRFPTKKKNWEITPNFFSIFSKTREKGMAKTQVL
jgi:hypothetical protein